MVAEMVECLPRKCKVLNSISSTEKKDQNISICIYQFSKSRLNLIAASYSCSHCSGLDSVNTSFE
jgi:hypothetical protein